MNVKYKNRDSDHFLKRCLSPFAIFIFLLFALCSSLFAQNGPPSAETGVDRWNGSQTKSTTINKWTNTSNWTDWKNATGGGNTPPNTSARWARIDTTLSPSGKAPFIDTTTAQTSGGLSLDGANATAITFNLSTTSSVLHLVPTISGSQPAIGNPPPSTLLQNGGFYIYGGTFNLSTASSLILSGEMYSAAYQGAGLTQTAGGVYMYGFSNWSRICGNDPQQNFLNLIIVQGGGASQYVTMLANDTLNYTGAGPAVTSPVTVLVSGTFNTAGSDPTGASAELGSFGGNLGGFGGLEIRQNATLRMGTNATLQIYSLKMHSSATLDASTNVNTVQIMTASALTLPTNAITFNYLEAGDGSTTGTITTAGAITVNNTLEIYKNTTFVLGGNLTVKGALIIDTGATLKMGTNTMLILNAAPTVNGTFDATTNTPNTVQLIGTYNMPALTYSYLEIGDGSTIETITLASSSTAIVSSVFEVYANATFKMGTYAKLTLKAAPILNGTFDITTNTPNTVQFAGTYNIPALTYSYLGIGDGATIGTITLASSSTVIVKGGLEVYASATFSMSGAASTLKLASGTTATVDASGTFSTSYTGGTNPPTITNNGSGTFSFTLGGAINVSGLYFLNGDTNGMNISTTATFTGFSNIYFNNALSTGSHLTIAQNSGGWVDGTTVYFDITPANVNNARTGAHNASVSSTTTPFTILFMTSNDDPSGAAGTGRGLALNGSSNTNVGQAVWVNNINKTPNALSTGATPSYVFPGNQYSYQLVHATGGDVLVAYNQGTGTTANTYTISSSPYGSIVGRPLVIPLDANGYGGAFGIGTDNIFFGTSNGYIFRLGYNLTVYTNYPDNLAGAITQVYSPVISDTGWVDTYTNNYGTNIYFAAKAGDGNTYCYGLDKDNTYAVGATQVHAYVNTNNDTGRDVASDGDPFPRLLGTYPFTAEPAVDMLNIGGSTPELNIFIASWFNSAGTGKNKIGHIWRVSKFSSAKSVDYGGTTAPSTDITGPVNEYLGAFAVGSSDTQNGAASTGTPEAYLVQAFTNGALLDYNSNFPIAAGSAIYGGVDTDFVSYVAYGTKLGYFVISAYQLSNPNTNGVTLYYNGFSNMKPDGYAINSFPLYNVNSNGKNEYFFGNSNGKVYKVFFGNRDGNDGLYIKSDGTTTSTATPFLDIGAGINITGLSVSGGELFVQGDNGALYVVNMGN